jgi:hypothetical protein
MSRTTRSARVRRPTIVAAVLAAVVAGCFLGVAALHSSPGEVRSVATSTPPDAPSTSSTGSTRDPATAATTISSTDAAKTIALLATLPVKGRAPMTGYDRTGDFGSAWLDTDRNGCDTRDDVLARDLRAVATSGACRVLSGVLVSAYTGQTIHFVRGVGTSTAVQIDHLVALGNAWQTGAQQLSGTQRRSLANDPNNLLAVDGRSNEQKGDGDAATWLPARKAFRCTYVARQVEVKAAYALWVTPAEHDAIIRVLDGCLG